MKSMRSRTKITTYRSPADEGSPGGNDTTPAGDDTLAAGDDTLSTGDDTVPAALPDGFDIEKAPKSFVGEDGKFDFEGMFAKFDAVMADQAIRDEAMKEVPESADGYEFAIPEEIDFGELTLPDGFKVEMDMENPIYQGLFKEAGEVMHKFNLPKSAASEFTSLIAKMEAGKYAEAYAARDAEFREMGNAEQRITNLERLIDARLQGREAEAIKVMTTTTDGIRALEKLLAPRQMGTGSSVPQKPDPDQALRDYYSTPTR